VHWPCTLPTSPFPSRYSIRPSSMATTVEDNGNDGQEQKIISII
jgi:hypothetical protein